LSPNKSLVETNDDFSTSFVEMREPRLPLELSRLEVRPEPLNFGVPSCFEFLREPSQVAVEEVLEEFTERESGGPSGGSRQDRRLSQDPEEVRPIHGVPFLTFRTLPVACDANQCMSGGSPSG
jgi:hypothetical protein